jgi:subtilisin family serine protease
VNLSLIQGADKDLRRAKIVQALKEAADLAQGPTKAFLQGMSLNEIIPLWIINGIAVTTPAWAIPWIANFPGVKSVVPDYVVETPPVNVGAAAASPEWNISAIQAPILWSVGIAGGGVVVANMDTGVDPQHAEFTGKWRGGANSWFNPYSDPANAANCKIPNQCSICETDSTVPCDVEGHGTGTMSIMVGGSGGGTAIGVAPDAKWIAVKALNDARFGTVSVILQGFQWILGLPAGQAPDIVNNSWDLLNPNGCGLAFQASIQALKAAGISIVFAAGNYGPSISSSISPANNVGSFAAGATDINNTIATFSSRGPSPVAVECGNGAIFPHVVAPGVDIKVAAPTNGGVFVTAYVHQNGTSFAAPHVAGTMALLLSAFPTLTPTDLESILEQTALGLVDISPNDVVPNNSYGYGLVDIANAYMNAFNTIHGNISEIASLPSSNNFGNMELKKTSFPQVFTIVNRGTANLLINPGPNGVSLSGANPSDFIITADTCSGGTIGSLLSCTVAASFSPTSAGAKIANISVQSNDPTTPVLNVPLNGTGFILMDTIGVYRPSNQKFYLRNSNTSGFADVVVQFGLSGDIPVLGDWDGNGTTTIGVYRPTNSTFYLRNLNTAGVADTVVQYGISGDIPIAGDWNGDGITTMGVYRPSNSTFYLRNSNTTGNADIKIPYGIRGDIPIVGDWTGQGHDTIGVYRPSNQTFYLRNSNTTGNADIKVSYGILGDMPIVGDWNGDGMTTIGVYRPSNSTFYLRNNNTTGFADIKIPYGIPGDIPVVGDWNGLP